MPCGRIPIRIDKPTPRRVIIPALQIVQPRFRVVDIAAVAERVGCAEGGGQRAGGGQRIAPCVVGVGHDARAAGADETGHIALCVPDVEILRAVVVHGQRAGRVVGKVQLIAATRQLHQLVAQIVVIVGRAVDGLRDALAVGIVAVGDIRPGLAHPCELAAVLPCVSPRAVAEKIADLVRCQALPADARQQIAPARVAVSIGNGAHRRAETSGRIGVFRFAPNVSAVIVGIRPRLPRRLIVLAHELVEAVVGIGRRALAVRDGGDVPARVVGVGIRRRAGFPRPDLPRGRCGRGIVVADRGLDHGLSAILRVHRGHPPQRVVGVARGDGSLCRFRQAVVLVVGIARGIGRAVERLLLRGEVIVVVIAPRDAVCIPAAALLPAHQPILKIVEILRLASARAVCQQTEVAVIVVGIVDLRAVLIADGRGAAKAVVAIGHRIAVAVIGPRELMIAVRAVAVADERARARLNALHQIERAVGKAIIRARGRGNRREQVACVALNLKPLADILRQLSFEMCFKQVVCNHTFVNDYTMLACP